MDLDLNVSNLPSPLKMPHDSIIQEMFSCDHARFPSFTFPPAQTLRRRSSTEMAESQSGGRNCWRASIDSIEREDGTEEFKVVQDHEWPSQLIEQLSRRLAEADAQAEIQLQLTCPACECEFSSFLT